MTAIQAPIMIPAPARRLGPLGRMRNTFTLTWRSVLKIRTNMEDVIGLSLRPIMFLLLFTYVFGGAIAHGSTHAYLQYALPRLLVMTVVFATLGTGLMLNQDVSSGVFNRFRSLPIARWAPLVKTPQGVQAFGFIAFFPLVFGSNLLAPTATMPGWLQAFVKVNPMTLLTEAERGLFTGGAVATPAVQSLLKALGIFVVFAPLAVRIYRRRT